MRIKNDGRTKTGRIENMMGGFKYENVHVSNNILLSKTGHLQKEQSHILSQMCILYSLSECVEMATRGWEG